MRLRSHNERVAGTFIKTRNIKRICVFCGSHNGSRATYIKAAQEMGEALVHAGFELVYGGGRVGLMGVIANTVLKHGGNVIGVIPEALIAKEGHLELADLRIVGSMHERKAMMAQLSDAFITLPGGYGTMEEFFEVLTWVQLGLHIKPCGILNVDGYYDKLLSFFDHAVSQQFVSDDDRLLLVEDAVPWRLLQKLITVSQPLHDSDQSEKIETLVLR